MSDIHFKCPECQRSLATDAAGAGLQITCPDCAHLIIVPAKTRRKTFPFILGTFLTVLVLIAGGLVLKSKLAKPAAKSPTTAQQSGKPSVAPDLSAEHQADKAIEVSSKLPGNVSGTIEFTFATTGHLQRLGKRQSTTASVSGSSYITTLSAGDDKDELWSIPFKYEMNTKNANASSSGFGSFVMSSGWIKIVPDGQIAMPSTECKVLGWRTLDGGPVSVSQQSTGTSHSFSGELIFIGPSTAREFSLSFLTGSPIKIPVKDTK